MRYDRRQALGAAGWLATAAGLSALSSRGLAATRCAFSVKVPKDRTIEVAVGPMDSPNVIVYMHGVCGDPHAFKSWEKAAIKHATFISMRGDLACKKRKGRFKWSYRLRFLNQRMDRAVEAADKHRWDLVDSISPEKLAPSPIVLIGYSQGAHRVQSLTHQDPTRFPRVVMIAPAKKPDVAKLAKTKRILLVAGEKDAKKHIKEGHAALEKAGRDVRYLELPGARHGEYGPKAQRVMAQGLDWLYK